MVLEVDLFDIRRLIYSTDLIDSTNACVHLAILRDPMEQIIHCALMRRNMDMAYLYS